MQLQNHPHKRLLSQLENRLDEIYKQQDQLKSILLNNKDLRSIVFAGSLPTYDQELPESVFKHVDIEKYITAALKDEISHLDAEFERIDNIIQHYFEDTDYYPFVVATTP